jgi:hypothetical protein
MYNIELQAGEMSQYTQCSRLHQLPESPREVKAK